MKSIIVNHLNDKSSLAKSIYDGLPVPMALFDMSCQLIYVNKAFIKWFVKSDEVIKDFSKFHVLVNSLLSDELEQILKNALSSNSKNNTRQINIRTRIKEHLVCKVTFKTIQKNNLVEGILVVFEDRSDVNEVLEMYKKQANLDHLTGIFNRFGFYEEYDRTTHSLAGNCLFAIAIIDIDDFKEINDQQGHLMGDKFIKNTAKALSQFLREGDILARWGGDEFIVILLDVFTLNHAQKLVKRLISNVCEHTRNLGTSVNLSVGAALWKHDGISLNDLIGCADKRMYENKQEKKNKVYNSL